MAMPDSRVSVALNALQGPRNRVSWGYLAARDVPCRKRYQHEPQPPWFLGGVTTFFSRQSIESGSALRVSRAPVQV